MAESLSHEGISYDAWLSEAPRGDARMPVVPQLQRFAQPTDMRDLIQEVGYTAILDASHVFDRSVTQQAVFSANALGLQYLRLERPAWEIDGHSNWRSAPDVAAANAMIGHGARVFCATGWDSVPQYAGFKGQELMVRQTRRHARPAAFPFVKLVFGDPPFSAADEQALFTELKVDTLICRNLGGRASRPKLDAAQEMGLDVILIERPRAPEGIPTVADIQSALKWALAL